MKFKKIALGLALAAASLVTTGAFAADTGSGPIKIVGLVELTGP